MPSVTAATVCLPTAPLDGHRHHDRHNDIIRVIDAGNVSVLVLLDLSAAFDTVDHDVLIEILNLRFGVVDCALD